MRYQIEMLTPVHIGSGNTLNRWDYVWIKGWVYVINLDQVLNHPKINPYELQNFMEDPGFSWEDYIKTVRIDPSEISYYKAKASQRPTGNIKEHIKVHLKPYIPGSSLKGAIRTAFLWYMFKKFEDKNFLFSKIKEKIEEVKKQKDDRRKFYQAKSKFAQVIEKKFFGRSPNYDVFRCIYVGDSDPLENLEVGLVKTYDLRNRRFLPDKNLEVYSELIPEGSITHVKIKIETKLFDYKELGIREKGELLENIPEICNLRAEEFIKDEIKFFEKFGIEKSKDFYQELLASIKNLPEGAFIINLGWATGWRAKTIGEELRKEDEKLFEEIRKTFRLGYVNIDVFPKTRRLYDSKPIGWIKLTPVS